MATITLDQPDPHFEDAVTFTVEGADSALFPTIQIQAFQDGQLVFQASQAAYPGGYNYGGSTQLGPSYVWTGGAADGKAILGHRNVHNGHYIEDATVEFAIAA